jgi:arylsulfatase A-like enzyme
MPDTRSLGRRPRLGLGHPRIDGDHRSAIKVVTTIRRAVNVVVYVSDALRADHLGCYGARFVNTRTIDDLAAGGARFDQAISAAPWTAPSMTSMVTGLYPHHHGYLHWDAALGPTTETLFRALGAHGYEIGTFVFDTNFLFRDLPEANVLGTSETLDGAVTWLRANREKPFLLFFHSWATHMPYAVLHSERTDWRAAKQEVLEGIQADSAGALEATREAYRQAVERQSEVLVAAMLEELENLGLRERTVFAFLSDHGESWGERFAAKEDVKGVYHMHGATLYDEVVEVPLVLSAPGRIEPTVVHSQVRSVDLAPTLLELAGLPSAETDGASLLPLLDGSEEGDRTAVIAGTDRGALTKLAVRRPPWKLILDVESGEEEAYRLDVDPRERESRPGDCPPELREEVFRELESAERRELTEEEEATVARRLADLGYL